MREKDVEKLLTEEVKHLGGRAYKWTSPGNAGVPDRIVIFPGRQPMFVELKTDKGTLSALQDCRSNACWISGRKFRWCPERPGWFGSSNPWDIRMWQRGSKRNVGCQGGDGGWYSNRTIISDTA